MGRHPLCAPSPSHNHSYTNTIVGSTTLTVNQIPSHTHSTYGVASVTIAAGSNYGTLDTNSTNGTTGSKGGSGSHTHSDISQSKTSGSTGDGTAFSIINPYKAVYIWTRTV